MKTRDEFELAAIHGNFVQAVLEIRTRLESIASGERNTHHAIPHTGGLYYGKKKLTLKESQSIARHAVAYLNNAVNEFEELTR